MPITLIGYRTSGKTAVAGPLAETLGWDWIDADVEIERRAGKSIREIFDDDGEPEFRRIERDVMTDLMQRDRLVIAAGGGAIVNNATRSELPNAGPVVWLQVRPETVLARLASDPTTASRRPGLTDSDLKTEVETLIEQRTPLYKECATITVATDDVPVAEVVEAIIAKLPADLTSGGPAE